MQFKDVLMRYHISPLQYEDGVQLEDRDYLVLFKMLLRYYTLKQITDGTDIPKVSEDLINRVVKTKNNSLIPFEPEELMDILMQKKGENL